MSEPRRCSQKRLLATDQHASIVQKYRLNLESSEVITKSQDRSKPVVQRCFAGWEERTNSPFFFSLTGCFHNLAIDCYKSPSDTFLREISFAAAAPVCKVFVAQCTSSFLRHQSATYSPVFTMGNGSSLKINSKDHAMSHNCPFIALSRVQT